MLDLRAVLCFAIAMLLTGCSTVPPTSNPGVLARLAKADAAYQSGNFDTAESIYLKLLSDAPPAVEARFRLGVIAYHRGNLHEAETYFQKVLAHDPRHSRALYDLSMVHLEQARRLLRRYEALEPVRAAEPVLVDLRKALERLARNVPATP